MTDDNLAMDRRLFGHSRTAHRLFGWCANCRDHTLRQEVVAWRQWAFEHLAAEPDPKPEVPA